MHDILGIDTPVAGPTALDSGLSIEDAINKLIQMKKTDKAADEKVKPVAPDAASESKPSDSHAKDTVHHSSAPLESSANTSAVSTSALNKSSDMSTSFYSMYKSSSQNPENEPSITDELKGGSSH